MSGPTPVVLLDDTIVVGAFKEALANRGYGVDTFPPGEHSAPCMTAIEAARQVAVTGRVKVVITDDLVETGIDAARTAAAGSQRAFDAIVPHLRRELAVLIQPCHSTAKSPLTAAIEVWEPSAVVTLNGLRIVRPRGVSMPLEMSPREWSARASDVLGR